MLEPLGPGDPPVGLWEKRIWIWDSWMVALAALVLIAVVVGEHWSWPLFGAGVALAGLAVTLWLLLTG
jgi:hypothetical protein